MAINQSLSPVGELGKSNESASGALMTDGAISQTELSFTPRRVIADAARQTGADFDFLLRTAARESNFDTGARARTSSAAGLFQFIEQTWLAMLSRHGEKHGYGEIAASITRDASGRFHVADPQQREAALDLRFDARAASVMAGELTAENAAVLRAATGREPSQGELYAAHFLGAGGAARLIQAAEADPGQRADALFPQAASANRPVFYDNGRALNAGALLARLSGETALPDVPPSADRPVARAPSPPSLARSEGAGVGGYAAFARAGVLSPFLVELLASLDAPGRKDRKA